MTQKIRIYISLLLFFFTLSSAFGQNEIGFKAGMLRTPYVKYEYSKYSKSEIYFKNTFSLAFLYKEEVSKNFTIGTNICYDFYESDYNFTWWNPSGGGGKDSLEVNFGFMGIYFYPQLEFGNRIKFFINAGPYIGFLINSNASGIHRSRKDVYSDLVEKEIDGSAKAYIRSFTFAIMSTIGIQHQITHSWNIMIDVAARYGPSLFNESYGQGQLDLIFSVGVGYSINKKTASD